MLKWQIGRCELEVQFWFAATVTVLILLSPAFAGALAAFHLLPIAPLDGGQALFALLSRRLPTERAGTVVWAFSLLILLPLAVLGFWVLLQSRYNFSLLAVSVYLMFLLVFKRGRFF